MAIYHLNSGFVSRSTGRSAVQSAAYITGANLYETRRELNVSYQNRHSDIAFSETIAPEYAPAEFHNIGVWDSLESFEDVYGNTRYKTEKTKEDYLNSARTAQTIVVALPRELSVEISKELVEEFAKERFVSRGLIVTYAIHDDEGNAHAHLQISRRSVNENGEISWTKDQEITTKRSLIETRKLWADSTNRYLEREGFEERITEKSFAEQGINLQPTVHRGWVADKLEGMGVTSRIVDENAQIVARNREVLLDNPKEILPLLTQNNATFSQDQLLKAIQKRIGDDHKLVASVFEGALKEAVVVGEGMDGKVRYTSNEYQALEAKALAQMETLSGQSYQQAQVSKATTEAVLESRFNYLAHEQKEAVVGLTQSDSLGVLIGRAGAGKTTTLKAVSEIYQASGHQVIGTSLSAMAADNLGAEAGINSATLHSWLNKWNRYQEAEEKFLSFNNVVAEGVFKQYEWYKDLQRLGSFQLNDKSVLIVDEAGMVGTRQWGELLAHVNKAGAKLIAVGDDNQFKAIEAGDFFREIKTQAEHSNNQLFTLGEIRRQRHGWMREASHQLAELQIAEGLSCYEQRGHHVHETTRSGLSEAVATAYVDKVLAGHNQINKETGDVSPQTGLVLAFTNEQTNELNSVIREKLKSAGVIGREDVAWVNGKAYSLGDEVVFLKNDKQLKIFNEKGVVQTDTFIKNGSRGTVKSVDKQGNITIQLAGNCHTVLEVMPSETPKVAIGQAVSQGTLTYQYPHLSHGYAVTTHKSQGQTVDFAIVAASKNIDAKGLYVAMTRHRDDVQLFYAKEDFASFKALTNQLGRFEHKDLLKDYTIRPEHQEAWQRVMDYKLNALDGAAVLKEQGKDGVIDWKVYQEIKQEQIGLGKTIINDFESHKLYLNQAGLTQEMLQISTGLKARPLSYAESKAKVTVELYAESAQLARGLWNEIKATHPGSQCYHHPQYKAFDAARLERNSLAHTIQQNMGLHREFINQLGKAYGINQRTVDAQTKQFIEQQTRRSESPEVSMTPVQENSNKLELREKPVSDLLSRNSHASAYQRSSLEPMVIREELNTRIKELAYELLGKPQSEKATEWRYGNKGSISIHVAGHKQGLYSNFETGESGNALKLIQDQNNMDYKQAFKWGVDWLGYDQNRQSVQQPAAQLSPKSANQFTQQTAAQSKNEWTTVFPSPNQAPNLKQEKQLAPMLRGRQETARYEYKDADHNTLGYVVRLEDKDGNKITPTLTWCRNQEGKEQWRWQGFGNDRPLYGLEQLKQKPTAPVLIVEGEKTCEAARLTFKDHAVITWSGGVGAVNKSDWNVLNNREVTIWPDHDKPGLNAAQKIAEVLQNNGNENVAIVDLPSTLPAKWDLADRVPDDINLKNLLQESSQREKIAAEFKQDQTKSLTKEEQEHQEKVESIKKYLTEAVTRQENAWLKPEAKNTLNLLNENPHAALKYWQEATEDRSFHPLNNYEKQQLTQQADKLINQVIETIDASSAQRMLNELPKHHEQGVIDKCQELLHRHQQHIERIEIGEFKVWCQKYKEFTGTERLNTEKRLNEIASKYSKNQEFVQMIDKMEDREAQQVAIGILNKQNQQEKQIAHNQQREINRGFER